MIKPARVDREKICVLMKALFCRNTLCIARKRDEIRAQIFRESPQAICSAFTRVEHHVDHLTWKLPTVWAYSIPCEGVGVRPFCFTNLFFLEVKP